MDTITHGIVGALMGKAFFADDPPAAGVPWLQRPRDEGRVAIVCATLGAMFPDVDVFETFFTHDNLAFLTLHRGITHSLPMLLVWSAGLAALAGWLAGRVRWPAPRFSELFSIFGAAIASHIFLDLTTSWGTMVWSPIDHTRLAWDWLFIIDLTLTLSALVPQLAAWVHRPGQPLWFAPGVWAMLTAAGFATAPWVRSLDVPLSTEAVAAASVLFAVFLLVPLRHRGQTRFGRMIWCRIGMALIAGYISFAAGMHYVALRDLRQFATESHIDSEDLAALPLPPWPGRWSGLIATPNSVYRIQFNLLGGEATTIQVFRDAAPNRYVAAARELPDVQKFLWFARFPVFTYMQREGKPVVRISDIRFEGPRRPGAVAPATSPATNFGYEVVFSDNGSVTYSGPIQLN